MTNEMIEKLKKNAVKQNIEINKLAERNKILEDLIKGNSKSIQELYNHLIDALKGRSF